MNSAVVNRKLRKSSQTLQYLEKINYIKICQSEVLVCQVFGSLPSSFRIGKMFKIYNLENSEKIPWHIYMKPFVLAAWTFLSIGIALGAVWAYYELGWGGWWFCYSKTFNGTWISGAGLYF